ncbi:ribonuclease E inhibitor RraA/Dimethylmenaquinone methyltransferase [Pisolithus orientalis]|uniref:ribonuclease E inhibitor RraA/Dimethylmenaquinone methyltransferase n=1 Tax=Pisolithus orientalis TaxID=936130 RepID=UPI00222551D9|nr:ribonuclease E inhibitor RraA/Dimethylmenaquinone methyltransferase [Pisolithus orientalis]KAI6033152.1 ribonuclease E inhibitor RraA/Dimethylmenaquinone methyltransferase [Pisolithus orientalis]
MSVAAARPVTLSDFSSCEISDALIKLGVPHGGHIPDISMFSPTPPASTRSGKICAPAYTVKMVPANDNTSPRLSAHFVDTVTPGSVIVIVAPPDTKNAVWGGLMTAGAQARGAVGVVISGRCRDLAEHRAAGFPVFARGHSTLGQGTFVRPSAIDIPLVITPEGVEGSSGAFPSTEVLPGDWIIADEDGVVCVPQSLVDQVVELATIGREIDARCMEDIKAGKGIQASFLKYRGK